MRNKHDFSESYTMRRDAVLQAVRREDALSDACPVRGFSAVPLKILLAAAMLSALTVSVYAAVQLIDFRMEEQGERIHVHASLRETAESAGTEEKPLRSWNAREGEASIRLLIPDLPADMEERANTNGKYHSADSSRSMTINGIDLRRSDLDQIIGTADRTEQVDAGGKPMFVIGTDNDAAFYNRTAYVLFEKEELVLKMWVSYGITDEELTAMASTMTIEETDDPLIALPIMNEMGSTTGSGETQVITIEPTYVYESDLLAIGESKRGDNDHYTLTVNKVETADSISGLKRSRFMRADYVDRFTDDAGRLIPYNRTEVMTVQKGDSWTRQFGETVTSEKKLIVITMTLADIKMDDFEPDARDSMLKAMVNGYSLYRYTAEDGILDFEDNVSAVVDRKPEVRADCSEMVYREYLGDNRWKVAFLLEEDVAEGDLVLYSYTAKIAVKIQ